ncbi:hypothetical protein B0H16DRAFT_1601975, partial [Mycena metata]
MSAVLFHCLLPLPLTFPLALPPPALLPVLCHDSPPWTACTVSNVNDWIQSQVGKKLNVRSVRKGLSDKPCHVPGTAPTKDTRGPNYSKFLLHFDLSVQRAISKVPGGRMGTNE